MYTDFLAYKGDLSTDQRLKDKQDLEKLQTLRGRLLHWLSIIEHIMNEYCGNSSTGQKEFGTILGPFLATLRANHLDADSEFQNFENALKSVHPARNDWAHGIIFYEKRDVPNVPKNNIDNRGKIDSVQAFYFDHLSKQFDIVIRWLMKNKLFKLSGYELETLIIL